MLRHARTRKFVGMVALLLWLAVYICAIAFLAVSVLPRNIFAELPFYAVAGIAWTIPARYLLLWMNRPDRAASPDKTYDTETDPP